MFYFFFIGLFALVLLTQFLFVFYFRFRKISQVAATNENEPQKGVSVIICAKNEAQNLKKWLPFVLTQNYPQTQHEVIVVNDQSTDDTTAVLASFATQHHHLKVFSMPVNAPKDLPGKKSALARGIALASYNQLLLTDADCQPVSANWLQEMTQSSKDLVLGYGAYRQEPNLLNSFVRWETVHTCMQYTGYAFAGLPYMGVGRNIAYKKTLLQSLNQDAAFQKIYRETPSGDDDLIISRIANKSNTAVCLRKDAHTISETPDSWQAWWRQKKRHGSTGKYYPAKVRNRLGLYALSHGLYWLLSILFVVLVISCPYSSFSFWKSSGCVSYPNYVNLFLAALAILRLIVYWANATNWYGKLGEKKLFLFFPLGDLGWALYNVFLSPYIFWKNKQQWK